MVSSASAQPINHNENFPTIAFLLHPNHDNVVYWDDFDVVEDQRNEIIQVDEPRHLVKRSPLIPPFDPVTKTLIKKQLGMLGTAVVASSGLATGIGTKAIGGIGKLGKTGTAGTKKVLKKGAKKVIKFTIYFFIPPQGIGR